MYGQRYERLRVSVSLKIRFRLTCLPLRRQLVDLFGQVFDSFCLVLPICKLKHIPSAMASGALRRLMAEYKQLLVNPPEGLIAGPMSEDNFFEWESCITGPDGTDFADGVFVARLSFPQVSKATNQTSLQITVLIKVSFHSH